MTLVEDLWGLITEWHMWRKLPPDRTIEAMTEAADRIEALEGALRGVRDRYVIVDDPEKCAAEMDAIARKALGEEKP